VEEGDKTEREREAVEDRWMFISGRSESQLLMPFLRNTGGSGPHKWVWVGVGRLDLGDLELAACN
jgi:hypothetical protein